MALEHLGLHGAELSVTLVGERRMQALNREYRGKDSITDVLSFPQYEDRAEIPEGRGPYAIGDIVICPARALAQTAEFENSLDEELRRLLVHGLVHLLGYDHERGGGEQRKARGIENELLGVLNNVNPMT